MPEKPPIARKRDAALAMKIGEADDPGAISSMFAIGENLYIVKKAGIYEVKLADQIDPERTNIGAPNTQQRVLNYGADSPLVGRILLTARELFSDSYLPDRFDHKEAFRLSFEMLKDLAVMADLAVALAKDERAAMVKLEDRRGKDGSVVLPAVGNTAARCKGFIQKADHSLQTSLSIVKLFYGANAGKKWFEGFAELVSGRYGKDDEFARFLAEVLPFLKSIRNARNCVEHARDDQRLIVQDFTLRANGTMDPPSVEVIHPHTPQRQIAIASFMEQMNNFLVDVQELMMVFMCDKHVQPLGGFNIQVVELPEDNRPDKHVRYSYGLYDANGRVIRAS